MKNNLLFTLLLFCLSCSLQAQKGNEAKAIGETILQFAQAADAQNADKLDELLDSNYRIVMNQLFGSTEVIVMDKSMYLAKINAKEFGGDKRQVKMGKMDVNGNTANVKVTFTGAKMSFASFIQLVKTREGTWKIVNEMPVII